MSADAEEILRLWKEGKPLLLEGVVGSEEEAENLDVKQTELMKNDKNNQLHNDCEPLLSHQNGINGKKAEIKAVKSGASLQQPLKAEKVNLEGEPKKKRGCCSLM